MKSRDGVLAFKPFKMGLKCTEQNFIVRRGLGNLEQMLVFRSIGEFQMQDQRLRYPPRHGHSQDNLLNKSPKHEQQRLSRFNLVLKLDRFLKLFLRIR